MSLAENQGVGAARNGAQSVGQLAPAANAPNINPPALAAAKQEEIHAAYATGPAFVSVIDPMNRINITLRRITLSFMLF